jgi:hypothetical protein
MGISNPAQVGVKLVLEAESGFERRDPRWLEETSEFHEDLRSALRKEDANLSEHALSGDGNKGSEVEIILALGSSGALGVALAAFRAWLGRDTRRSIHVKLATPDGEKSFAIDTKGVDSGVLDELARAAMQQVTKP